MQTVSKTRLDVNWRRHRNDESPSVVLCRQASLPDGCLSFCPEVSGRERLTRMSVIDNRANLSSNLPTNADPMTNPPYG